jgi:hypothetical protein
MDTPTGTTFAQHIQNMLEVRDKLHARHDEADQRPASR